MDIMKLVASNQDEVKMIVEYWLTTVAPNVVDDDHNMKLIVREIKKQVRRQG